MLQLLPGPALVHEGLIRGSVDRPVRSGAPPARLNRLSPHRSRLRTAGSQDSLASTGSNQDLMQELQRERETVVELVVVVLLPPHRGRAQKRLHRQQGSQGTETSGSAEQIVRPAATKRKKKSGEASEAVGVSGSSGLAPRDSSTTTRARPLTWSWICRLERWPAVPPCRFRDPVAPVLPPPILLGAAASPLRLGSPTCRHRYPARTLSPRPTLTRRKKVLAALPLLSTLSLRPRLSRGPNPWSWLICPGLRLSPSVRLGRGRQG